MRWALAHFGVAGPGHNLPFFEALLRDPGYCSGDYDTSIVKSLVGKA